jgi:hypothetical protein
MVVIDDDWISEAEPLDALGNLPDLLVRMRAGVVCIRVSRLNDTISMFW